VLSFKSKAWQLGLTGCLLLITYLGSRISTVSSLEYDLYLYIVHLSPSHRELAALSSIRVAPQWLVILVYAVLLGSYVHKYTRSRTTAGFFVSISILLFILLMLEVFLAVFSQFYLPLVLPGVVMLLASSIFWLNDSYRRLTAGILLGRKTVTLADVQHLIEQHDLKTALFMLKQCSYSDELLEVGYELGMSLESSKKWASALNLYHWLTRFDPGLSDYVTRVEEIRQERKPVQFEIKQDESLVIVGHYELIKKIARGATAIVYEAYDMRTSNIVALKVMSSQLGKSIERERIDQWLHEAEIVSQFEHKNIVKIHDAARDKNTAFIAMDYIHGYPLSKRLRKREYITVGECIRISKSVLSALVVAHKHDVIHGDIKPANIMYDEKLDIYIVTDFGAAYTGKYSKRGNNIIIGTPSYMSPEQLQGKKLDGRSDLFSLAVTLYHLLTGHQPFTGSNLHELKRSIINDEPDLDHFTLPVGIIEVIMKALQKKTYMRFADAQQMLSAVEFCEAQLLEKLEKKK
jgi:tRNA A-37 threonylcarbamoyl transferase component Bud32